MLRIGVLALGYLALVTTPAAAEEAATLRGSPVSMVRQHDVALERDYTFLRTGEQIRDFAERGYLTRVEENDDVEIANVSFPYARPELRTFVERLAAQYREGCGEKLVITSLTRPTTGQPSNSHRLSVHPAGMAVDLRVSRSADCRGWLEDTLLALEAREILDVTRERNPPHYHVAVFPEAYSAYVAPLLAADSARLAEERRVAARAAAEAAASAPLAAGFVASDAPDERRDARALAYLAALALVAAGARIRALRASRGGRPGH